jgi:ACS family sodium-dependent inorganic phosphate cotransporter
MASSQESTARSSRFGTRHGIVGLCAGAMFISYLDRVLMSVAIVPMATSYGWSDTTKGFVLSSFFLGYLLMQPPSGWLTNRLGGRLMMGLAVLCWSLCVILTPIAAAISLPLLIATRVVMGFGEALTTPSIYYLFGRWLLPLERTRVVAFTMTGLPLGMMFGFVTLGELSDRFGWTAPFYIWGFAGLPFAALWFWKVRDRPALHPKISPSELAALSADVPTEKTGPVPWRLLLTKSAVWALVFNHFCSTWTLYLLLSWVPSYFMDVHQIGIAQSGLLSAAPWLSLVIFSNAGAIIADKLLRRGWSVTLVRKVMQVAGLLGSSAFLMGATQATEAITAMIALCGALGAIGLTWSGFAVNHLDIAPRYADVVHGITNTAGTIPGIVGVAVTGWLVETTGSYTSVFVVAAVISVAGAIVWILWGTGRRLID